MRTDGYKGNITCTGQDEATTTKLANALLFNWIIIVILVGLYFAYYNNYWEVVEVIKGEVKFYIDIFLPFLKTTKK